MIAPLLTGWMAEHVFGGTPNAGLQDRLHHLGLRHAAQPGVVLVRPPPARRHRPPRGKAAGPLLWCWRCLVSAPVYYFLLTIDAPSCRWS
jgi:hypothetical protein